MATHPTGERRARDGRVSKYVQNGVLRTIFRLCIEGWGQQGQLEVAPQVYRPPGRRTQEAHCSGPCGGTTTRPPGLSDVEQQMHVPAHPSLPCGSWRVGEGTQLQGIHLGFFFPPEEFKTTDKITQRED